MFGNTIRIEINGYGITLRPIYKAEMEKLTKLLQSHIVTRYTNMVASPSLENELKWFDKTAESKDTVHWGNTADPIEGIPHDDQIIGVTSLHDITSISGSCTSGLIIADQQYWRRNIAYMAHLIRTYVAWNNYNRDSIMSQVRVPNIGSLKALQKVGYFVSGKFYRNTFVDGMYLDTYVLSCLNPARIAKLYPDGLPEEAPADMYNAIERGRQAMEIAKAAIKFM